MAGLNMIEINLNSSADGGGNSGDGDDDHAADDVANDFNLGARHHHISVASICSVSSLGQSLFFSELLCLLDPCV